MSVVYDHDRHRRIGLPEAVLCEGKPVDAIIEIADELSNPSPQPLLLTRLSKEKHAQLPQRIKDQLDFHPLSRTAYLNGRTSNVWPAKIAVVSAGTSDLAVAWEAARTLEFMGVSAGMFADLGVAGLWRLQSRIEEICAHDIVIIVAGMDAALAAVLGGLCGRPLIAVPTSVGYGVAEDGRTALHSMLVSCSPGITVVNIDNGYGAACGALRILASLRSRAALK